MMTVFNRKGWSSMIFLGADELRSKSWMFTAIWFKMQDCAAISPFASIYWSSKYCVEDVANKLIALVNTTSVSRCLMLVSWTWGLFNPRVTTFNSSQNIRLEFSTSVGGDLLLSGLSSWEKWGAGFTSLLLYWVTLLKLSVVFEPLLREDVKINMKVIELKYFPIILFFHDWFFDAQTFVNLDYFNLNFLLFFTLVL